MLGRRNKFHFVTLIQGLVNAACYVYPLVFWQCFHIRLRKGFNILRNTSCCNTNNRSFLRENKLKASSLRRFIRFKILPSGSHKLNFANVWPECSSQPFIVKILRDYISFSARKYFHRFQHFLLESASNRRSGA